MSSYGKKLCVFCGSSRGTRSQYAEAARELGRELVRRHYGLVYGGGNVGLMGILADTVLELGGEVVGVIPQGLLVREVGHQGLSELRVVDSMHERKASMAELAVGFVALPGGMGTLEELLEVLTWAQLGIHSKPCGLLDADAYFDPLLTMFDRAVAEGFLRPEHRNLLVVERDPSALIEALEHHVAPEIPKWLDRDQV